MPSYPLTAACNEVDLYSLTLCHAGLDGVHYLPGRLFRVSIHAPAMRSGPTSLQGAVSLREPNTGSLISENTPYRQLVYACLQVFEASGSFLLEIATRRQYQAVLQAGVKRAGESNPNPQLLEDLQIPAPP